MNETSKMIEKLAMERNLALGILFISICFPLIDFYSPVSGGGFPKSTIVFFEQYLAPIFGVFSRFVPWVLIGIYALTVAIVDEVKLRKLKIAHKEKLNGK
jgi:hypothetical protein